jgi:hypothetical protein
MSVTAEVTWRAWLGAGEREAMEQVESAEFTSRDQALEWVERRLSEVPRDAGHYGSVDRGLYLVTTGDGPLVWLPDLAPDGMLDADLVDGAVVWRRPGALDENTAQDTTGHTG